MEKAKNYDSTIHACFLGYIVQAIVNNFAPLLFLTFQNTYDIPLAQITLLITINFGVQLLIDLLSAGFVDRIGYRASLIAAHVLAALGLICMAILPDILPSPFIGLLLSVILYAIGGGLLEVMVSPVVESCPSEHKEKTMSLLHSFYCWGQVGVVLLSTLYFTFIGTAHWKVLACLWAIIPIVNMLNFARVPLAPLIDEDTEGLSIRQLLSNKLFWFLFLMMACAGASELAVSQWASTFAEKGLGVSKTFGDLAGPMAFAVLMGLSRLFYGKYGDRINLERFMSLSSILCIASYLLISLSPSPLLSLVGCAICGLSVGIMWPGTFSTASASIRGGGTAMFAFLALAGDLGCSGGPTLVGFVSDACGGDLKKGMLVGVLFPLLLLVEIGLNRKSAKSV